MRKLYSDMIKFKIYHIKKKKKNVRNGYKFVALFLKLWERGLW